MLRSRYKPLFPGCLGWLTPPLFRARLVAHVGGADEVVPGDLLELLDVQEGFLQCLLVYGAREVQPRGQRVAELVIGKGAHFLLEHGHLSFSEARAQVVDHEGYELAFSRLAVRHRCLLERVRRPSLQRKGGCVQVEAAGPPSGRLLRCRWRRGLRRPCSCGRARSGRSVCTGLWPLSSARWSGRARPRTAAGRPRRGARAGRRSSRGTPRGPCGDGWGG